MNPVEIFEESVKQNIENLKHDTTIQGLSRVWMRESHFANYDYNFRWMGRPVIQMPQDLMAMQELIFQIQPELIIETGIAHGGSLVFYASMMELLGQGGQVLGIDIDIRQHNRKAIEEHPMFKHITMIEGSSVDTGIVEQVKAFAAGKKNIMVSLDSNHTHDHVLRELELYSPLVPKGSYLVVFDTMIEDMFEHDFPDRPWKRGNSPKSAVKAFLEKNDRFVIDEDIESKILLTVAPSGYLKCVKD